MPGPVLQRAACSIRAKDSATLRHSSRSLSTPSGHPLDLSSGTLRVGLARLMRWGFREMRMAATSDRLLTWAPRVLGILVALFLGLFAFDAARGQNPVFDAAFEFVAHAIPAAFVLALVAAAWHRRWIGAVGFTAAALAYAVVMSRGRVDWILVISGPLLIVGVLFLWSWIHGRGVHTS